MDFLKGLKEEKKKSIMKGGLRFFLLIICFYWAASFILLNTDIDILDLDFVGGVTIAITVIYTVHKYTNRMDIKQLIYSSLAGLLISVYITLRNIDYAKQE